LFTRLFKSSELIALSDNPFLELYLTVRKEYRICKLEIIGNPRNKTKIKTLFNISGWVVLTFVCTKLLLIIKNNSNIRCISICISENKFWLPPWSLLTFWLFNIPLFLEALYISPSQNKSFIFSIQCSCCKPLQLKGRFVTVHSYKNWSNISKLEVYQKYWQSVIYSQNNNCVTMIILVKVKPTLVTFWSKLKYLGQNKNSYIISFTQLTFSFQKHFGISHLISINSLLSPWKSISYHLILLFPPFLQVCPWFHMFFGFFFIFLGLFITLSTL
jgi:hypothetical protein